MPRDAAESILSEVWGERGFPVDPVWIANQLGIDVVEADLPDDVSGALIKESGRDPVILIEREDSRSRRRFSCAHEIGHYISRTRSSCETYEYVDLRGKNSGWGTNSEEIYANRFAANLLMPERKVRDWYSEGLPSVVMAYRFGVSDEAMQNRLKTLKLG